VSAPVDDAESAPLDGPDDEPESVPVGKVSVSSDSPGTQAPTASAATTTAIQVDVARSRIPGVLNLNIASSSQSPRGPTAAAHISVVSGTPRLRCPFRRVPAGRPADLRRDDRSPRRSARTLAQPMHLRLLALVGALSPPPSPRETPAAAVDPIAKLAITWDAPAPCASPRRLRERLSALLAASSEAATTGELRAKLSPSPGGWTMAITVESAAGSWQRTLAAPRCDELVEAAALIAAITLDPVATARSEAAAPPEPRPPKLPPDKGPPEVAAPRPAGPQPSDDPEGEPLPLTEPDAGDEPPASAAPVPSPTGGPPSTRRRALGVAARAGLAGAYGPFPGFGALLVGGLGLTIDRRALVELAALHRFQTRAPVDAAPGIDVAASLTGGRISACWTPRRGQLEVPLCAGLDLAALRVEAVGLRNSDPATDIYAAASAGARLLWRPTDLLGVGLDLGGAVTLRRRDFTIRDLDGPALTTTPASAHAGLSLEIRLP
jgi:hypothetical protein